MRVIDILKKEKIIFSCEFFPPKTDEGMIQLYETVKEFKHLNPGYISVTYGAGGGTKDKTIEMVGKIKREIGIETMAHLTCVGHSKDELKQILNQIYEQGVENVIALRGDPPKGETHFMAHPNGFKHANELIEFIRASHNGFCIAAAGYPEGHVESPNKETDWNFLEKKVIAGADFIITQLFFDNRDFFFFVKRMREKGITQPIIPGIMPITNYNQILKFTQMCGSKIPEMVVRDLNAIKDDLDAVQNYGIEYATKQCEELIAYGVSGIHFYTLNKSKSTKTIIENLQKNMTVKKI